MGQLLHEEPQDGAEVMLCSGHSDLHGGWRLGIAVAAATPGGWGGKGTDLRGAVLGPRTTLLSPREACAPSCSCSFCREQPNPDILPTGALSLGGVCQDMMMVGTVVKASAQATADRLVATRGYFTSCHPSQVPRHPPGIRVQPWAVRSLMVNMSGNIHGPQDTTLPISEQQAGLGCRTPVIMGQTPREGDMDSLSLYP